MAVAALVVAPTAMASPAPRDAFGGPSALAPGAAGIAVAASGRVYVADEANQRVVHFAPDGTALGEFNGVGTGSPRTNGPVGVAVDAAGRVFVTETGGDRLLAFTEDGDATGAFGGHGTSPGQLDDPAGVAVARDGSILVVDSGNRRVQAFAPTGGLIRGWSGDFADPHGIAVAPSGDVYVTDRAEGRVHRFRADGTFAGSFDGAGTAAGKLVEPTGIAVDRDGAVHVADAGRGATVTFAPDGGAERWGGFTEPSGVATDCRANVYVVDSGAMLVRRFGRPGAALPPCGPPSAAFTITPLAALLGTPVFLDGSSSSDDSRIVRFEWDVDGDGVFDVDGGGSPTLSRSFDQLGAVPLTLRVTDDDGQQSQTTEAVTVLGSPPAATAFSAQQRQPLPQIGVTALAARVSGQVLLRRPGAQADEPLGAPKLIPMGSTLDTTSGRVRLTFAKGQGEEMQTGEFWGGRFEIFQSTTSPLAELVLADAPAATRKPKARKPKARAAAKRRGSKLWGDAKGNFRTTGRNATATVRGTVWLVDERDAGTRVKVDEGEVTVRDLVRDRTVSVRAGDEYVARDACRSRRRFRITLREPQGVQARSALVLLNGKPVKVERRGGRLTALIDLRGRLKGTEVVRITLWTTTGVRITGTRRYLTCAPEGDGGPPPPV